MAEILITNMKLPEEGEVLRLEILSDGSVIEVFKNECGGWNKYRSGGVKAKEIASHGTLKDTDRIIDSLMSFSIVRDNEWFSLRIKNKVVTAILESAPTVIPASGETTA